MYTAHRCSRVVCRLQHSLLMGKRRKKKKSLQSKVFWSLDNFAMQRLWCYSCFGFMFFLQMLALLGTMLVIVCLLNLYTKAVTNWLSQMVGASQIRRGREFITQYFCITDWDVRSISNLFYCRV